MDDADNRTNRPDDWAHLVFDEDFVSGAAISERSADERARQAARSQRQFDLNQRMAAAQYDSTRRNRTSRRRHLRSKLVALVVALAIVGTIVAVRVNRAPADSIAAFGSDNVLGGRSVDPSRPTPSQE